MHTTRSDGHLTPEDAVGLYRKAGYDFLALTDHWAQSREGERDGLLLLSGGEWDTGDMIHTPVYHIVGAGMRSSVKLNRGTQYSPQQIIDAIRAAGGTAILAHPAWSQTDPNACLSLTGLGGAEIYNSVSTLPWNGDRADSSLYFDLWAAKGKFMRCMAADDSHFYQGEHTRSFLMVNAADRSADAVRKAIAEGRFYASQGPRFRSVTYANGRVEVRSSPVETVVFYSNTVWCHDRVATGGVESASYEVKPTDRFVRVELWDRNGNRAWTSPFPVQ